MGEESLSGPEVNFVFRMEKLAGSHPLNGFEGEFGFLTF